MQLRLEQRSALGLRGRCPIAVKVQTREVTTTTADVAAPAPSTSGPNADEIYIGFAKGDYAPRAGRKGRVIKDDPRKYPAKEDLGLLSGATGGWAGGEAALWELREQVLAEKQLRKAAGGGGAAPAAAPAKPAVPKPQGGKQPIYVGYGKSDLDLRKAGAPGRFMLDDPRKYPAKEDIGFLPGATGGFAGGERGLQQFVRDGDLQLRPPGERGTQFSPVAFAGVLAFAGVGGGLLLDGAADVTERGIAGGVLNAPIDDGTKTLLLASLGLMAAAGTVAGARAAAARLSGAIAGGARRLAVLAAFWASLLFAARAVLEL